MKFVLIINLKFLTIANSFLLNIAEHEILLLAFSCLLAEKFSRSAELSMKKSFITSGPDSVSEQLMDGWQTLDLNRHCVLWLLI